MSHVEKYKVAGIQIMGLICIAIGIGAITGHISGDYRFYRWHGEGSMALNTAIVTTLQGIALFLIGKKWQSED